MQRGVLLVHSCFVRVLSFSDQHTAHVKVSVSCRRPDYPKSKLRFRVFANVERNLVLWIFSISELRVCVCRPSKQLFGNFGIPIVRCIVQRSPLAVIQRKNVCLGGQKQRNCLERTLFASKMQRGAPLDILTLQICLVSHQQSNHFGVISLRSKMQRRFPLIWIRIDTCALL